MNMFLVSLFIMGAQRPPSLPALVVDAAYLRALGEIEKIPNRPLGAVFHPTQSFRCLEDRSAADRADWTIRAMGAYIWAMELYFLDCDGYPPVSSIQALGDALRPYLPDLARHDGWGYPLRYYVSPDRKDYRISSPGLDGVFDDPPNTLFSPDENPPPTFLTDSLRADIIVENANIFQAPRLSYPREGGE
jgi:hypothetical protein